MCFTEFKFSEIIALKRYMSPITLGNGDDKKAKALSQLGQLVGPTQYLSSLWVWLGPKVRWGPVVFPQHMTS